MAVYPPLSTDLRVDIAQEGLFGLLGDVVLPHLHLQQLEQLAAGEAALPVGLVGYLSFCSVALGFMVNTFLFEFVHECVSGFQLGVGAVAAGCFSEAGSQNLWEYRGIWG